MIISVHEPTSKRPHQASSPNSDEPPSKVQLVEHPIPHLRVTTVHPKKEPIKHDVCAVAECNHPPDYKCSHHRFPKPKDENDSVEKKRLKAWVKACKRDNKTGKPLNPATARICKCHFSDACWERDSNNQFRRRRGVKVLKKDAIPDQGLHSSNKFFDREFKESLKLPIRVTSVVKTAPSLSNVTLDFPIPMENSPGVAVKRGKAVCAVPECKSDGPSFHRWPLDDSKFQQWCDVMSLDRNTLPKQPRICSSHFSTDCFQTGANFQKRLKKSAVPTFGFERSVPLVPLNTPDTAIPIDDVDDVSITLENR